jgi:hypothetical protein
MKNKLLAALSLFFASLNPVMAQSGQEYLRVNLYQVSGTGTLTLADGNLTNYHETFSNGLDDDAPKITNFGENFAILRSGQNLAIEQRQKIYYTDTTYFNMWNMAQRTYRLQLITYNLEHPGLEGYLIDNFTNTTTTLLLNSSNNYDFTVSSAAGSSAANRFKVVFRNPLLSPLPTTFTSFNGRLNGRNVELFWNVNNETDIREYVAERSVDRVRFTPVQALGSTTGSGTKSYFANDAGFIKGDNYYRIKAVGRNGEVQYSTILKINAAARGEFDVVVYPNPVQFRKMNLSIDSRYGGRYLLTMYSMNGVAIPLNAVDAPAGLSIEAIRLPVSVSAGIYRLRIVTPEGNELIKTVNVQ